MRALAITFSESVSLVMPSPRDHQRTGEAEDGVEDAAKPFVLKFLVVEAVLVALLVAVAAVIGAR